MRLSLTVLGHTLLEIEYTRDGDGEDEPLTFGFHASGAGLIERCDETMLDTVDRRRL